MEASAGFYRQALLALAHLRCGDTYAQLAAGFGIGIATVFRYIRDPISCASRGIAPSGGSGCPNTIRTNCDTNGPP